MQGNSGPDLGQLFNAPQNGSRLNYVMNTCLPDQVALPGCSSTMKCQTHAINRD